MRERIRLKFYANVHKAASVDVFKDRRGGADNTGKVIILLDAYKPSV